MARFYKFGNHHYQLFFNLIFHLLVLLQNPRDAVILSDKDFSLKGMEQRERSHLFLIEPD